MSGLELGTRVREVYQRNEGTVTRLPLAANCDLYFVTLSSGVEFGYCANELEVIEPTIIEQIDAALEADAVAHPAHYTASPAKCSECGHGIECIDITQHMSFNLGNALKYIWRCDLKRDAIEDLRKAKQYLDFEITKREREASK